MALPVLETPVYELELLSKKDKIKFRPFLVKEQKILMTAMETDEKKGLRAALIECANACTFNKLDINRMPIFDLERLFLYIRAKSVGEELPLSLKCEKEECGEFTPYALNLISQMKVANLDKVTDKVEITDEYGFVIAYPNAEIIDTAKSNAGEKNDLEFYIWLFKLCLIGVYNGEAYHTVKDASTSDIDRVIDSLNQDQWQKVQDFFDDIPKVSYDIEFDCKKCGHHNRIVLEGIDSFFG